MRRSRTGGRRGALTAAFLVLLLASPLWLACSFNYETLSGAGAEVPDAVFEGFSHSVYLDGVKVLSLSAAHAEAFDGGGRMVLRGVAFTEYDRGTGKAATTGTADGATFWSETENAEFSGNIRIASTRDDASLATEFLAWDGKKKTLSSGLDRTVEIRRGDGSWVRGAGFSADSRRRSFAFREAVEGTLFADDKKPAGQPAAVESPSGRQASGAATGSAPATGER